MSALLRRMNFGIHPARREPKITDKSKENRILFVRKVQIPHLYLLSWVLSDELMIH